MFPIKKRFQSDVENLPVKKEEKYIIVPICMRLKNAVLFGSTFFS